VSMDWLTAFTRTRRSFKSVDPSRSAQGRTALSWRYRRLFDDRPLALATIDAFRIWDAPPAMSGIAFCP